MMVTMIFLEKGETCFTVVLLCARAKKLFSSPGTW